MTADNPHATTTTMANMDSSVLLGHGSDWWSVAMLASLGLAAVVAAIVAGTTAGLIVVQKREALVANLRIATLEADNLKLETQLAPRRLTPEKVDALAAAFRALKGKNIEVKSYALDAEGTILAKQIIGALQLAELSPTDRVMAFAPLGGLNFGIVITGSDPVLNAALRTALERHGGLFVTPEGTVAVGSALQTAPPPGTPPPDATILVAAKPMAQ